MMHLAGFGRAGDHSNAARCFSMNASSVIGGRPPSFSTRSFVPAKIPFWWSIATSLRCWTVKESPALGFRPARRTGSGGRPLGRILPAGLQHLQELLEADLLVLDGLAEHPAQDLRRSPRRCIRPGRRAGRSSPLCGGGVFEDAGDHAALVLGGDRGVLAGAERHVEQPGLDHRGEVEQPLGEVGRPDVGDRQARPVEDPLGQPVVGRGVALGVLPGGLLRHVDDAVDARLLRGLGEIRRRLQDAGADGVDEVGPLHAVQRGADLAEVEQVAVDDLDAPLLEPLRPVVLPVGQRPDLVAAGQQFVDRRPAGVPRRAGDQDLARESLEFSAGGD